jgi:LysM repeat protein
MILDDPARYGLTLPEPLPPPGEWTTIQVSRPVQLAQIERALELPGGSLTELNPALRSGATPPRDYALKVPLDLADGLGERIAALPEWRPPTPQHVTHRVRRGDTLSVIARRYGSSVEAIMKANNLRSANRISPGQRLQIPTRGDSTPASAAAAPPPAVEGTHVVRAGESLYSIARRYNTTVERLRAGNGLTSNTIHPGQTLRLQPGTRSDARRYQVQQGDTLSGIADRHRIGLSALLSVNGLGTRSTIYPGQWLVIPQ